MTGSNWHCPHRVREKDSQSCCKHGLNKCRHVEQHHSSNKKKGKIMWIYLYITSIKLWHEYNSTDWLETSFFRKKLWVTVLEFKASIYSTRRSRWCVGNYHGLMLKCQKKKKSGRPYWIFGGILTKFGTAYNIHFWISFVLCVVFKYQYFWSYSRKTQF